MDVDKQGRERLHAFDEMWIKNNLAFLFRYWRTATDALENVKEEPERYEEFEDNELGDQYVHGVISSHLDHHHYSGLLLTYAVFDEFMASLTKKLGHVHDAAKEPGDLSKRGVKRYKKYIHDVCGISTDDVEIDWSFLHDFETLRHAVIHANGNKSLLKHPQHVQQIVDHRSPLLSFKHDGAKLVVTSDFVTECIKATGDTALKVNDLSRST